MLDEAFTVKMMKIGKCPLKNWNQLCLTRTWQWTESFVELLAIAVGHLCQAMFMGLSFFLYVMFLMSWRSFVKWQHTHFICTRIMLPFFPLSKLPLFWVLWGVFLPLNNNDFVVILSIFCRVELLYVLDWALRPGCCFKAPSQRSRF